MKTINEDMKQGKFHQIYLLCGEEAYLKKQYKYKIKEALIPDGDTMNYAYYEGKGIDYKELIDLAETMPFFAERRVIIVENSLFFKNAMPEFADYLKEMPDTTYFVFVESEVDKRGKMYKAVKAKGHICEFSRQDEKTLLYWIAGHMKRENKQIKESTAKYFISKVGTDMETIEKELEKLFCYTIGNGEITREDVDAICTTQITNKIFDMLEAVATKQQRKALDYYYDLLALKEPPMRILYMLSRQFSKLLEVKELMKQGFDQSSIAKTAGLHPFVTGKYMKQSRFFSSGQLLNIMEEAAEYEEMVKTGRMTDRLSVELFIVKQSRA